MDSLGSLKYRVISSANKDSFTYSFPTSNPFIYFPCLIALAQFSSTILNKSGESKTLISFWILEKMLSVFPPLSIMLVIGLSYIAFFMSILVLICSGLLSWRDVKYFQRLFSASIEMLLWFFSLILFMSFIMFIDLHMLNYPCILRMRPAWSQCRIFLMCCWIQFAKYFYRRFLHSCPSRKLLISFHLVLCYLVLVLW
jgi:hypothetical protein